MLGIVTSGEFSVVRQHNTAITCCLDGIATTPRFERITNQLCGEGQTPYQGLFAAPASALLGFGGAIKQDNVDRHSGIFVIMQRFRIKTERYYDHDRSEIDRRSGLRTTLYTDLIYLDDLP